MIFAFKESLILGCVFNCLLFEVVIVIEIYFCIYIWKEADLLLKSLFSSGKVIIDIFSSGQRLHYFELLFKLLLLFFLSMLLLVCFALCFLRFHIYFESVVLCENFSLLNDICMSSLCFQRPVISIYFSGNHLNLTKVQYIMLVNRHSDTGRSCRCTDNFSSMLF